jgi:dephospho-CoA kinase
MAFGAFQTSGFQRNAFQILTGSSPAPVVLLPKGGLKKERVHNRSFKQTVKESLEELLGEPKVVEQVKEIVSEYSNSNKPTLSSIDLKLLSQNVEAAQRIIMMAERLQLERLELQREMDDEEAILLLI